MRKLAALLGMLAVTGFAGEHYLIPVSTTVSPTTAVKTVTYDLANKGPLKAIGVWADNGTAADEHVVTGTVSAVRGGQSRSLASFTVTTGTPLYLTMTNALFNETLSTTWTAGGTNSESITYTVDAFLIYER